MHEHFYNVDILHSSEHNVRLKLLENDYKYVRQKREVQVSEVPISNATLLHKTELNDTLEAIPLPPPKKKLGKPQKVAVMISTTQKTLNNTSAAVNVTDQKTTLAPSYLNFTTYVTKTKTEKNYTEVLDSKPPSPGDVDQDYPDPDIADNDDQIAAKHNISQVKYDTHIYYNSTLINDPNVGQHYWVDLTNRTDVKINELLSESHRRAATVKLSFGFPFYGHLIKNVTIATGGFLYTGDYVHSWLAATQYIAPLMANFDTSLSNSSFIKYVDNGTAFTVEWEKVTLQERPDGEFTFQVTIHKSGDIIFVYKNVPLFIEKIQDAYHPVKVGLSDAYIMDRTIFFVRRKTIYEYHRVEFKKEDIRNWTVIYLKPLETCHDSTDCISCLNKNITYPCMWCPLLNKCSSGIDRNRQDWLTKECNKKRISNETMCGNVNNTENASSDHNYSALDSESIDDFSASSSVYAAANDKPQEVGISGILAILFLLAMVTGLAVWVFYAYRNPHTASGQMLIRYRPSQWRWRRGEARYTAATIHM
ncbi:hypothetical protein NQ315_004825 [Exocentrus adspersus]|uniref:Plexin domain-containing protein 2 n=1 Tax=Exocentrus adspersus TaxID=1586481 RepID=A0AAV8W226_9CUCU|nr:hypothetical protein NQ315_004825 [Exocentrus adspersus]